MHKYLKQIFSWFLVFSCFLFYSCEKQGRYDLFPLKVGNEFYYNYYEYRYSGITAYIIGTETWKVVSESSNGNSKTYHIERNLNGTLKVAGKTINISDSLRYFDISEDKSSSLLSSSSMLLYNEISFKRYQNDYQFEFKQEGNGSMMRWSYLFKADSGLTKYTYYHPPNQVKSETLTLVGLKRY